MIRGTTPSFTFRLPFNVDYLANAKVIFSQGETTLEKKLDGCEASGNELTVRMTQEESFLFKCHSYIQVQLRVVTITGDALSTEVFHIKVNQSLDEEVLS